MTISKLKFICGAVILIAASQSPADPPPSGNAGLKLLRVILLGGQSNADGRAPGSGLPVSPVNLQAPQTNVLFYYYTNGAADNPDGTLGTLTTLRPGATQTPPGGFGPEVALGCHLSSVIAQQPGAQLVIIKYAKGGSSLAVDWKAGGDGTTNRDGAHYRIFQRVVKDGLAKLQSTFPDSAIQVVGMAWVQGESDIDGGSARADVYATNLVRFISDVRQTFSATLPFFFSRISARQKVYSAPTSTRYANYLVLRSQQEQVAATVTNTCMIDTDSPDFTMKPDFLHFDAGGQQAMGAAFAAQIKRVLGGGRLREQSSQE